MRRKIPASSSAERPQSCVLLLCCDPETIFCKSLLYTNKQCLILEFKDKTSVIEQESGGRLTGTLAFQNRNVGVLYFGWVYSSGIDWAKCSSRFRLISQPMITQTWKKIYSQKHFGMDLWNQMGISFPSHFNQVNFHWNHICKVFLYSNTGSEGGCASSEFSSQRVKQMDSSSWAIPLHFNLGFVFLLTTAKYIMH